MFAIVFEFPSGRYHATPWGRHVNEADVAWPPEPWRILRAFIATYWRKGNKDRWNKNQLIEFINVLAETLPVYYLPEGAIHAHVRHYMPSPAKKTLIFDAFAHIPKGENIIVAWPDIELDADMLEFASDLAEGIGYLGRAESWVECRVVTDWNKENANCGPLENSKNPKEEMVNVIAPCSADDYATERLRLIKECETSIPDKQADNAKSLEKQCKKAFGPTLPAHLADALALDTGDYRKYGWNRPPASREVVYTRLSLGNVPKYCRSSHSDPIPRRFSVVRYILAGRPRPRVENTVQVGEVMRLAALSKFGWANDSKTGKKVPKAPSEISGRDVDGNPLKDAGHSHAFWLPEDADGDGWIDHISVYSAKGFSAGVCEDISQITELWTGKRESDKGAWHARASTQKWQLALEGVGCPDSFSDNSRIFKSARVWTSATPFLASGHLKKSGYAGEIRRLLIRRGIVPKVLAEKVQVEILDQIEINGVKRRPVHFHRFRSRRGEKQFDTQGALVRLIFPEPITGPLSLGYASHFGLGLFSANT